MTDGRQNFATDEESRMSGVNITREIGDTLNRGRLALGLEIDEVVQQLRIKRVFIEAIEDGRFDDLPGSTYVAGFIGTYASFLGLDGNELVTQLREHDERVLARQPMDMPVFSSEVRQPTRLLVVLTFAVMVAGLGGWFVVKENGSDLFTFVDDEPETLIASSEQQFPDPSASLTTTVEDDTPADAAGTDVAGVEPDQLVQESSIPDGSLPTDTDDQTAEHTVEPDPESDEFVSNGTFDNTGTVEEPEDLSVVEAEPEEPDSQQNDDTSIVTNAVDTDATVFVEEVLEEREPSESFADDLAAVLEETGTAAEEFDSAETETIEANSAENTQTDDVVVENSAIESSSPSRIEIRATAASWIQIEGPDGEIWKSVVLNPGESYLVPDIDDLTLDTGNAGGLEIWVDGVQSPALGGMGEIRRDVALDPALLIER